MPNVNLIPQDRKKREVSFKRYTYGGLIAAIVVVAALIGGFFIYDRILDVRAESIETEIMQVEQQKLEFADVAREASVLQTQLANLTQVLNNHLYWSEVLWVLEETTLKETSITTMQATVPGSVEMIGSVSSYTALAKQIVAFMSNPFFSNYEMPNATLAAGADGATRVDFAMSLEISEDALTKTDEQVVEDSLRSTELPKPAPVEEAPAEEVETTVEAAEPTE